MTINTTSHGGLVVPNATTVVVTNLAEPDAADFNIVGNSRFGVVSGCNIAVQGGNNVQVSAGVVLINGAIVQVPINSSVSISAAEDARFGIVWIDTSGAIGITYGEKGLNPVYPDLSIDRVAIAGVYTNASITDYNDYVVDKRNILVSTFVSAKTGSQIVMQNIDNGNSTFSVTANGRLTWGTDTSLYKSAAHSLHVDGDTYIDGIVVGLSDIQATNRLAAGGTVTGSNLVQATSDPATAPTGALYQNTVSGAVSIRRGNAWREILTSESALPVGTVIQSFVRLDENTGWLLVDGRRIYQDEKATLYGALADSGYEVGVEGLRNYVTLPDTTGQGGSFLRSGGDSTAGSPVGGNAFQQLVISNMPAHTHNVALVSNGSHSHNITVQDSGSHIHSVSPSGAHKHTVVDSGHTHDADETNSKHKFIVDNAGKSGASGRLDPVNTDSSHTAWTYADQTTGIGKANLSTADSDYLSLHTHSLSAEGGHSHLVSAQSAGHEHNLTEDSQGSGTSFNILPPYVTVRTYIRY